jgi:cell division septum initiation protein DivIVA
MSIRMVAAELYRVLKQIERLEMRLENLPGAGSKKREEIENMLREARIEKDRLKRIMEGAKGN